MTRHRRIAIAVCALGGATAACSALLDLQPPPEQAAVDAASPADRTTPEDRGATGEDALQPDAGGDTGVGPGDDASGPPSDADASDAPPPTCVAVDLDAASPDGAVGAAATYTALDAAGAWESYGAGVAFSGGTFDGRFVYLAPAGSVTARFDTQSDAGFASPSAWVTANLGALDPGLGQFNGTTYDGRYVYLVPWGGPTTPSGLAARFDTSGASFAVDSGAWATFDTTVLTGGSLASGFEGAVFDGRFVYFVPSQNGVDAVVARYDTAADDGGEAGAAFASAGAWSTFDLAIKEAGAANFMGGVYDGAHLYLIPRPIAAVAVRFGVDASFTDPSAWATFPVQTLLIPGTWTFGGGAFDGRYVYFLPRTTGVVLRFDTHDKNGWAPANGSTGGWSAFDMTQVLPPSAQAHPEAGVLWPYAGAGFDGRFLYVIPRGTTVLARYDTFSTFDAPCAWTTFDLANVGVAAGLPDYYGAAVFDGQYLYLVPHNKQVPALRFQAKTPPSMPDLRAFHGSFY
jgi:hypothetical protein